MPAPPIISAIVIPFDDSRVAEAAALILDTHNSTFSGSRSLSLDLFPLIEYRSVPGTRPGTPMILKFSQKKCESHFLIKRRRKKGEIQYCTVPGTASTIDVTIEITVRYS